ncbi:unnamed protein product [Amoebophrya sp. A120]|nr:unnamed protein product [Amoebophrya sp. A120]|eukprot:GSA120T00003685001.1
MRGLARFIHSLIFFKNVPWSVRQPVRLLAGFLFLLLEQSMSFRLVRNGPQLLGCFTMFPPRSSGNCGRRALSIFQYLLVFAVTRGYRLGNSKPVITGEGHELVYRDLKPTDVGVLLLFHGCSHPVEDWQFLPEEQSFLREAQMKNLGYIAFETPMGKEGGWCWPPKQDEENVDKVLKVVRAQLAIEPDHPAWKKTFCLGGSSGGNFIGVMGVKAPDICQGFAFYVSPGGISTQQVAQSESLRSKPVAWVYMDKDTQFASGHKISQVQNAWCSGGGAEDANKNSKGKSLCKMFNVKPRPLTKGELNAHHDKYDLYGDLVDMGYLDVGGSAIRDPRSDPGWQGRFFKKPLSKEQDQHRLAVEELMNRAWAQHEFAADYAEEVLDHLLQAPAAGAAVAEKHEQGTKSEF